MMNPADDMNAPQGPSPSTKEYQAKLLDKLTALVGVIDIAIARVRASMAKSQGDQARLQEILDNLNNTRSICLRARGVLQQRLGITDASSEAPEAPPKRSVRKIQPSPDAKGSYREFVEFSSANEMSKFKNMDAITSDEVNQCDIDALLKQIQSMD